MSWFGRNAQPKEEHPSTYPDTLARVDECAETRPPQGGSVIANSSLPTSLFKAQEEDHTRISARLVEVGALFRPDEDFSTMRKRVQRMSERGIEHSEMYAAPVKDLAWALDIPTPRVDLLLIGKEMK